MRGDRAGAVALQQYVGERIGGRGTIPRYPFERSEKGYRGMAPRFENPNRKEIHDEDTDPHVGSTGVDRKGCG